MFLKWDEIEYENYSELIFNKTNDTQCLKREEYAFELEYRKNLPQYVMIKNKASNK